VTPQDQEFTHKPEIGQFGDCLRAVIATLLDMPISAVPHFNAIAKQDPTIFWESLQAFCASQGYAYLTVPARCGHAFFGADDGPYHEISGPSPRGNGVTHAVVGRDGQIVFDPHPSRAGLVGDPAEWKFSFLVRNVPAAKQGGSNG
jgi:hypothetical protein